MTHTLVKDTENISPTEHPALHYGLSQSVRCNYRLQTALDLSQLSPAKLKQEITDTLDTFFDGCEHGNPPLVLTGLGSKQHNVALVLQQDSHGNTSVFICNRENEQMANRLL